MINYICDLCGEHVKDRSCLVDRTLISLAPIEWHKVQFCEKCKKNYENEQETAKRTVDMRFLKDMGRV